MLVQRVAEVRRGEVVLDEIAKAAGRGPARRDQRRRGRDRRVAEHVLELGRCHLAGLVCPARLEHPVAPGRVLDATVEQAAEVAVGLDAVALERVEHPQRPAHLGFAVQRHEHVGGQADRGITVVRVHPTDGDDH
jgi:hypothetical protein